MLDLFKQKLVFSVVASGDSTLVTSIQDMVEQDSYAASPTCLDSCTSLSTPLE